MLDGNFHQEDLARGRRVVCNVHALIVPTRDRAAFIAAVRERVDPARDLVDRPQAMSTFAGEIPWCDTFPKSGSTELAMEIERRRVPEQHTEPQLFRNGQQLSVHEFVKAYPRSGARSDHRAEKSPGKERISAINQGDSSKQGGARSYDRRTFRQNDSAMAGFSRKIGVRRPRLLHSVRG